MTICLVLIDALYDENSQSFLFKVNLLFRAMTLLLFRAMTLLLFRAMTLLLFRAMTLMHLNETKRKALVSQVQRNFD